MPTLINADVLSSRPRLDILPSIALPFYVRSVGIRTLPKKQIASTPSFKNNFYQFNFIFAGHATIKFYEKNFAVGPNDVFYNIPGEDHFMQSNSNNYLSAWIALDGPLAGTFIESFHFPRHCHCAFKLPFEKFQELIPLLPKPEESSTCRTTALVTEILCLLASGLGVPAATEDLAARCYSLIIKHISSPELSVKMLADLLSVHPASLTRIVRKKMTRGPKGVILSERHRLARTLLAGTDLPISVVASRCGFEQLTSFIRFFRSMEKIPPGEFRISTHKRSNNNY